MAGKFYLSKPLLAFCGDCSRFLEKAKKNGASDPPSPEAMAGQAGFDARAKPAASLSVAKATGRTIKRLFPQAGFDARAKPAASLSAAKATGTTVSNPPFFATAKNDQSKKKKQWRANFICQSHCLLFAGIAHGFWQKPKKNGASDRIRTGDSHVGNVILYQLSYTRSCDVI